MAENQGNSTKSDEQKLAELEKQLNDKSAEKKLVVEEVSKAKPPAQPPAPAASSSKNVPPSAKSVAAPTDNSSAATKIQKNSGKKANNGLLWLVTIINLLFLILLVGAAYWTWQQWQTKQQDQTDFFSAQQQLIEQAVATNQLAKNELEQQEQSLQSRIESLLEQQQRAVQSGVESMLGQVNSTAQQAEANKRSLSELTERRPSDWLLAEADYLLRMAGRKLWLEHDEKTALLMLQSADGRLQELDDPSLLPIRQQLAIDMQNLQQINSVSYSSIALSISGLIPQVDSLKLAFFKRPEDDQVLGEVSESVNDWQTNLANNLKDVTKDFFSYKKISTEIKPFMSEQQQWLSREQLKFTLMTAQTAILKEDAALYLASMQSALNQLAEYFDIQNEAVLQFHSSLSGLVETDVQRLYPDRFLATNPLSDVIDIRLNGRLTNGNQ